jgi:hypothetical protein
MVGYMRCLRALQWFLVTEESCCIFELAAGLILWGYQKFKQVPIDEERRCTMKKMT